MNKNLLKKKLRDQKQVYGCWVTIPNPLIPEILSFAGFDFLVIDMEHSSIDLSDLPALIMSCEKCQMTPLVRVGELNANLIKRVMDVGACGIIAANVCSKEEAEFVVNSVKYPPTGKRGVGLYRAQGYGETFEDYKQWVEKEALVVIQIENIKAIKNIDSIFTTSGIDACLVGPYDLSASLGHPGDFDQPELKRAMERILQSAKKNVIAPGFHSVSSDPELARQRCREGYRFLAFSTDFMLLKDAAKSRLKRLKEKL